MISLRKLELSDLDQALGLSKAEKWNQTEKEWELLIGNSSNLCYAAVTGSRVVGTATAINYGNEISWIGMVIVHKEFRGQKISNLLLNKLFENSGNYIALKLDATPAGQPVYQKLGFKNEYNIFRLTSTSTLRTEPALEPGVSVERGTIKNINEIAEYDKLIFGSNRKQLIEFLIKNFPDKAWLLRFNGKINGISLGRLGSRFHHIGPVLTTNSNFARVLISKSLEGLKNLPVVVDIPEDKTELLNWLITIGFTKQRYFVRMYRNENNYPGIPENQFLICGPEFG